MKKNKVRHSSLVSVNNLQSSNGERNWFNVCSNSQWRMMRSWSRHIVVRRSFHIFELVAVMIIRLEVILVNFEISVIEWRHSFLVTAWMSSNPIYLSVRLFWSLNVSKKVIARINSDVGKHIDQDLPYWESRYLRDTNCSLRFSKCNDTLPESVEGIRIVCR